MVCKEPTISCELRRIIILSSEMFCGFSLPTVGGNHGQVAKNLDLK